MQVGGINTKKSKRKMKNRQMQWIHSLKKQVNILIFHSIIIKVLYCIFFIFSFELYL